MQEKVIETYDEVISNKINHVFAERFLATFFDFLILFLFLILSDFILGNELYQRTFYIWISLCVLYYPLLEFLIGRTLGKFIFKIKIIDRFGNKPRFSQVLIRTFFRIFEVNPFFIGGVPAGIAVLFSKKGQRIGDMVAKTYVVSTSLEK